MARDNMGTVGKRIFSPRRYNDKMKFESIIQDGENSDGLTAQTPNGTAHWKGKGWNNVGGSDRPSGRANRTGE